MKIKLFTVGCLLLLVHFSYAQKYISKSTHIRFYSHTPMEDIEADNHQVASILDIATGDLSFSLLIKSFEFKRTLMQEHFNENYMESDKFPKAGFKGKITNIAKIDFKKDGSYPVDVTGELTIHGTTKTVTATGTIEIKGGVITANSKFEIVPQDYDIKIPTVVAEKFAKQFDIYIDAPYNPFK